MSAMASFLIPAPPWKAGFPNGFSTRVRGASPPAVGLAEPWGLLRRPAGACGGEFPPLLRRCGDRRGRSGEKSSGPRGSGPPGHPGRCAPSPGAPGTVEADGLITRTPRPVSDRLFLRLYPGAAVRPQEEGGRGSPRRMAGGTALGIAARAAEAMIRNFGCRPGDLMAAIGPGISLCCFETHGDVPAGLQAGLGGRRGGVHPPGSRHGPIPCGPEGRQPPVAAPGRPVSPPYRGLFGLHRLRQRRFLVPPPAGLPPGQPGLCDPDPLRCP